jgi:hypothetical protein
MSLERRKIERFGEISTEWRQKYLKRTPEQLPRDMVAACDEIRSQRKELNILRGQLLNMRIKNSLLFALLGGAAAKGIEVLAVALWKAVVR